MNKANILFALSATLLLMESIYAQDFSKYSPSAEYTTTTYGYTNGVLSGISYFAYLKKDKGGLGTVTVSATRSGSYNGTVSTGDSIKVTLKFRISLWGAAGGSDYTEFQLKLLSSGTTQLFLYRVYPIWSITSSAWRKIQLDTCTSITVEKMQGTAVGVLERQSLPKSFSLLQNYPNPFNPTTTISFDLPSRAFVLLKIFNALGQEVSLLVADELTAGTHTRQWNPAGLPSGVYFYRLQAGEFIETKQLLLLR